MAIRALLKRNTYYDSITLMSVAQAAASFVSDADNGATFQAEETDHD